MQYLPPLKSSKLIGFLMLLGLGLQPEAKAALVISNGDISSGHYIYGLNFTDMNGPKFTNDVFSTSTFNSQTAVSVVNNGSGAGQRNYLTGNPTINDSLFKTASFVYKFDFSTTSFRPTALTVADTISFFGNNVDTAGTIATSYSTDGTNFTTINTITGTPSTNSSSNLTTPLTLTGLPAEVYYKVSYSMTSNSFGFGAAWEQWNRQGPTSSNPFSANFTVVAVPEPTTVGMFAMSGSLALLWGLRRKDQMVR